MINGFGSIDISCDGDTHAWSAEVFADNGTFKGGHAESADIVDVLFDGQAFTEFRHERVPGTSTHGTGCTFSAAITAQLALGRGIQEAIPLAQAYVAKAIRNAPGLGSGHGPMGHL